MSPFLSEVLLDQVCRDLHPHLSICDEEVPFNPKRLFFNLLELLQSQEMIMLIKSLI